MPQQQLPCCSLLFNPIGNMRKLPGEFFSPFSLMGFFLFVLLLKKRRLWLLSLFILFGVFLSFSNITAIVFWVSWYEMLFRFVERDQVTLFGSCYSRRRYCRIIFCSGYVWKLVTFPCSRRLTLSNPFWLISTGKRANVMEKTPLPVSPLTRTDIFL